MDETYAKWRRMLIRMAEQVIQHANDPAADYFTLAEMVHQTTKLIDDELYPPEYAEADAHVEAFERAEAERN